jgi:uncharacterized repeat protein (TIGR01451 family)
MNTTTAVTSNIGNGNTASDTTNVVVPPTFTKVFADSELQILGPSNSTTLTFSISNPASNPISLSDVSFTDPLPSGLVVSTPNGLTGSCGGGTITADPGSTSISLSGATLASGASCTFSVSVSAIAIGVQNNITSPITAFGGTIVGGPASASTAVDMLFFNWFFVEGGGGDRHHP